MADEDEIDILGDFALDNLLSKNESELYNSGLESNCECSYVSSNSNYWYNSHTDFCSELAQSVQDIHPDNQISAENSITDENGWTVKERNLLKEGIEIFGRSSARLAQFIGTKSTNEVKYYLKHAGLVTDSDVIEETVITSDDFHYNQVLDDTEIPASIEQVIAVVSSTKPTVPDGHPVLNHRKLSYRGRNKSKAGRKKQSNVKFKINNILNGNHPNFKSEEVIKIKKEDSNESDLEIDVENDHDGFSYPKSPKPLIIEDTPESCNKESMPFSLPEFSEDVMKQLQSMEMPSEEVVLIEDVVTNLEMCVNSEFFSGRPAKTPERYLKIRNYILSVWFEVKPLYVTKSRIRPGLKNCGDVNSIGRIHQFLEQVGAINFGCAQTAYVRPLYDLVINPPSHKEKVKEWDLAFTKPITLSRPRFKRKLAIDGEGGLTLAHDEKGNIINTTVVNEEPVMKRSYTKRPMIRLVYCKPFSEENPQRYKIRLHLSSLLLMDLHAHTSRTEVMGLIAGYWDPTREIMEIMRYVPCKNIASSSTHCDMCPISQAKAADIIHSEGLNILGWFHSHPTFAPEPSLQDMDTQLSVQQWIGNNKPCIGLILSPFSAHGALIASPFRCLIVDKKPNFDDQYVPFKFKIDLVSSELDVDYLLSQAWRIFNMHCNVVTADSVIFNKPYFLDQSITYFDKFIYSVKMHLAKCIDINKMTCDSIIQGFYNICCR